MPTITVPDTADLRLNIVGELLDIPGLGGAAPSPDQRLIHPYAFESDDTEEARTYWETENADGDPVINGVMLTREVRSDLEPNPRQLLLMVHRFKLIFRYAKRGDPEAEKTFEEFVDAILNKLQGNSTVFKIEGIHPQIAGRSQVAEATMRNLKLFQTRVWEATIRLEVVVQGPCPT